MCGYDSLVMLERELLSQDNATIHTCDILSIELDFIHSSIEVVSGVVSIWKVWIFDESLGLSDQRVAISS